MQYVLLSSIRSAVFKGYVAFWHLQFCAASKSLLEVSLKRCNQQTFEQIIMNLALRPHKLAFTLSTLDQIPKVHWKRALGVFSGRLAWVIPDLVHCILTLHFQIHLL